MATMTKIKRSAKKTEKPAAASSRAPRRTSAELDELAPKFVKAIQGGAKMRELKAEYGFSDDGPIRSAMYRAGYDSKGNEHGETAGSIDATKAAGKKRLAELRKSEGAGVYRLAYLSGLKDAEVKKILADAGATDRVYVSRAEPKAKAAPKAKAERPSEKAMRLSEPKAKAAKKPARRVKATKADPS